MTKEEIIKGIQNLEETTASNSIGCSENWYNPYYALREAFGIDYLESLSEKELNVLFKLADSSSEVFY